MLGAMLRTAVFGREKHASHAFGVRSMELAERFVRPAQDGWSCLQQLAPEWWLRVREIDFDSFIIEFFKLVL